MAYNRAETDQLWQLAREWANRRGPSSDFVEHVLSSNYSVEAVADVLARMWQQDTFGSEAPRQICAALLHVRLVKEQIATTRRLAAAATRLSWAAITLGAVSALVTIIQLVRQAN